MYRTILLSKIILLIFFLILRELPAQDSYELRILQVSLNPATDTMLVEFTIIKNNNSSYNDLQQEDVKIWLNNQICNSPRFNKNISHFPIKCLIVLDQSGSMRQNNKYERALKDISILISSFDQNILTGIIGVANEIKYIPLNSKNKDVVSILSEDKPEGNTRLYDGIYKVLQYSKTDNTGLSFIAAFSDGIDLHSKYTATDCLQLNSTLNIPIYIFLYNNNNIPFYKNLNRLAELSGGKVIIRDNDLFANLDLPKRGTANRLYIKTIDRLENEKWVHLRIQTMINNQIYSAENNVLLKIKEVKLTGKKQMNAHSGLVMIIAIGLGFVLTIIWVIYMANRKAKTTKCPFCSKRYDINLETCPSCRQNTMQFYETGKGNNFTDYQQQSLNNYSEEIENDSKTVVSTLNLENEGKSDKTIAVNTEPPPLAYLIIKKGDRIGKEYPLAAGMNTIGRDTDNTISIEDPALSGRHLKLWKNENDKFLINDLASTNGTYVNDVEIVQEELKDKDEILAGKTLFTFIQIS